MKAKDEGEFEMPQIKGLGHYSTQNSNPSPLNLCCKCSQPWFKGHVCNTLKPFMAEDLCQFHSEYELIKDTLLEEPNNDLRP